MVDLSKFIFNKKILNKVVAKRFIYIYIYIAGSKKKKLQKRRDL